MFLYLGLMVTCDHGTRRFCDWAAPEKEFEPTEDLPQLIPSKPQMLKKPFASKIRSVYSL